ncbi:MAG: beta-ketoacyl-ACP synthase II [Bacteroidota bacterium]
MKIRRVAVTGLGALTPLGNSLEVFWKNLEKGVSGATPITSFNATHFKTQFACEVKDYKPEDNFDRKEIRRYDLFTQYAILTAEEALKDSGLALDKINTNRFGVIWASGNGGINTFENEMQAIPQDDKAPRFSPFFIPRILVDTPSGVLSIKFGLKGLNYCTVSACASSNTAIIDAFNYIKWGKVDFMIAGGSESAITKSGIGGFNAMKALSTRNDDPLTASRPFDVDRDGFVMGEGAGALILEEYEHAVARGAKIYAELVGGGMTADAYHMTASHPDGLGALAGMNMAAEDAEIEPSRIGYINTHATSTPLGDIRELKAIKSFLGKDSEDTLITATKSMTGHLLGAAGAIEALATIMGVYKGVIPPTINTVNPDPEIPEGLNIVFGQAVQQPIEYALSNTFGFGGHNSTIIFKRYDD